MVLMTLLGFVHTGGHRGAMHAGQHGGEHGVFGHRGGHGAIAHGHGHGARAALPHSGSGHHSAGHQGDAGRASAVREGGTHDLATAQAATAVAHQNHHVYVFAFIPSPLDVFSFLVGAGLAGMLFRSILSSQNLVIVAVLGAFAFNFAIVKPIFALLLRFASTPSEGLEGRIATTAEAITRFDEHGKGLVRVNLDGQIVQLLAKLEPDEHTSGVTVAKGDEVVVTEVNPKAGTCTISRDMVP